jgi:hypothetical protein
MKKILTMGLVTVLVSVAQAAATYQMSGTWYFGNDSEARHRPWPNAARCNWRHEAQLSTTDSRKSPNLPHAMHEIRSVGGFRPDLA